MGKWFKKTFHPGKCAREAEQKAADSRNAAASQARQEQARAEARKKAAFKAIYTVCSERREKIESWYGSELKQAEEDHVKNQVDYHKTLAELSQAVIQAKSDIEIGFEEQCSRLLENQAEDTRKLEESQIKVIDRVTKTKAYYNYKTQTLDGLWQEVQSNLLHQRCQEAYLALKGPLDKIQKTKNYSILIAYMRHLFQRNHLANADFERYIGFFEGLYRDGPRLNKDSNFYHIDDEINRLFSKASSKDNDLVISTYDSEKNHCKKIYEVSQEFNKNFSKKLETARKDIGIQYGKAQKKLVKEKEKKLAAVQENYVKIQFDIESEIKSYEEKYEAYIFALMKDRDTYCLELEVSEKQAKEQVGEQYEAEIAAITDATRKIMDKINTALSEELKQIRKAKNSAIANIGIAVAAGVGAYFSGGLLAGFGATIIETAEASLTATSIGAVSNFVNGKDGVGFKFTVNLEAQGPLQDCKPLCEDGDSHRKKQMDYLHLNLESIRDKFSDFSKNIEQWQSEAEDHLFYFLNKSIRLPTVDFSESMIAFFNQKPGNFLNVQLGALNQDGLRTVDWGTGRSVMFDKDLRWMFKKIVGVDEPFSKQDWHQSQVFSFDQNALQRIKNKIAQENHLISLQGDHLQAVRKKSRLEGVLNYLIPVAAASELNYFSPLGNSEGAESNTLLNKFKVGTGFVVGLGKKALSIATDIVVDGIKFLQYSEAIIDDPQLIDAALLDRRAAQGKAFSFALQSPVETGKAIYLNYQNDIKQGASASRLAYHQGQYFESGRVQGESWAEPAMALAGSLQLGKFAVKTITQGIKSGSQVVKGVAGTHEFRSPILFQYDSASLNMGSPLDRIELRNPVRKIMNQGMNSPLEKANSANVQIAIKERVRNNFNILDHAPELEIPFSNLAHNANAQAAINKKLSILQKAQNRSEKTENVSDGRIRYYTKESPSKTPGNTRGASYVTEYNPSTGQVRTWHECYDHSGNVNRVHPKTVDGQDLIAQHYPPTKSELESFSKKPGGPK